MTCNTYVSQRMKKKTSRSPPWTDRTLWRSALLVYLASFSLIDNKISELWKIPSEPPGRWARIWEYLMWGRISFNSNSAQGFNWIGLKGMAPGTSRTTCFFSADGKGVSRPQTSPSLMPLFWVQIWGLPFENLSEDVGKDLGNNLGRYLETDKRMWLMEQARFLRVRVDIPFNKPLHRGGNILNLDEEKTWVNFKYERLPFFCYVCGYLGHDEKHCPNLPCNPDSPK